MSKLEGMPGIIEIMNIASRLRSDCHNYDGADVKLLEIKQATNKLVDELTELVVYLDALEVWEKDGEVFYSQIGRFSGLFTLGVWWADRPWRKKQ